MISARPTPRDSLLFVYGTLRAFVVTAAGERLRRRSRLVGYARVAGRLYDLGGYPGLGKPRRAGEWVVGEMYRLRTPRRTLRALDRYERGAGFARARAIAYLADGSRRCVWVYRFLRPVYAARRIAGGDYERRQPAAGIAGAEEAAGRARGRPARSLDGARTEGRRL
jgi:gamma-glutamylcyclotransferase (GGCT)/AIG2-like uncharacterized protein YtfP